MNPSELSALLLEAVDDLRQAHVELDVRSRNAATSDATWRGRRAAAYAETDGTVAQREAAVEVRTNSLRYEAKLAEDLRVSALEAARSKRSILSAIQSLAAMTRSEMDLAKYGPEVTP